MMIGHLLWMRLAYPTFTPILATDIARAYLLRGYTPVTGSTILPFAECYQQTFRKTFQTKLRCGDVHGGCHKEFKYRELWNG